MRGWFASSFIVGAALLSPTGTDAADAQLQLLKAPPERPDPKGRYLFYLHGRIIEEAGRRPKHPRWGFYEYDAILRTLGSRGHVVISEQRPKNTGVAAHAKKIATQIRALRQAGVAAEHIAVVGFSKGGAIASQVLAQVDATGAPPPRYVLMGSCLPRALHSRVGPHGRVLLLKEKSDALTRDCPALPDSLAAYAGRESMLDIGGEHGAFYRPVDAWLAPLWQWLEAN
ncbi:MAG: alpha/beta hydrolase [Myxococcales bacterium]|nr:alpha/beta hydrolase [Myxococcales bacterium]